MASYKALHLDPDEEVIFEVRKHWIVFAGTIVVFCFFILLPLILYFSTLYFVPSAIPYLSGTYFRLFLFFYILWILFFWIGFFLKWTKFFLDVWYVTGKRIIDIEQ